MSIIIGLIILGLVFTFFEVFVPGGILGIMAAASFIGSCVISYQNYGIFAAIAVCVISLILTIILLVVELKYLQKTKIGKKMFLNKSVEDKSTNFLGSEKILRKTGKTLTTLAPTGRVLVEGQEYEGFSEDGLINKGEVVTVVDRDNFRIIVKRKKI